MTYKYFAVNVKQKVSCSDDVHHADKTVRLQLNYIEREGFMRPKNGLSAKDRIFLPLDVSNVEMAQHLVDILAPYVGAFKIGLEFIYSAMASLLTYDDDQAIKNLRGVRKLAESIGASHAFLDGKFDDIPNTVGKASLACSQLGVGYFNVHASAGLAAIKAAVANRGSSKVLGVTILTSIDPEECLSIFGAGPGLKVLHFAKNLVEADADGIICSPKELSLLRAIHDFDRLMIVTPGVRPKWGEANDQKRVLTPAEAIQEGADMLVIGRPITGAISPVSAAIKIAEEIEAVL